MRKLLVVLTTIAAVVAMVAPASAKKPGAFPVKAHVRGHSALEVHQMFFRWSAGSATNTIFNGGCGEIVGKIYLAPVSVGSGTVAECDVPPGVPIAVSPAGVFSEIPTWGSNDAEIIADAEATFAEVFFSEVSVDGRAVDPWEWTISAGAYDVMIEEGSALDLFCEGIPDPCQKDFVAGEVVRIASMGQVVLLKPMRPGTHVIEFADQFSFSDVLDMTLTIHVG